MVKKKKKNLLIHLYKFQTCNQILNLLIENVRQIKSVELYDLNKCALQEMNLTNFNLVFLEPEKNFNLFSSHTVYVANFFSVKAFA